MSHAHTAQSLVCGSRNDDYGNPRPDFERIASVWSGIIGEKLKLPLTAVEIGLLMTGLKLVRHAHKPKDDNLVDALGYLMCVEWIETGVKPVDEAAQKAAHYLRLLTYSEERIATLEAMVETVACGERLPCPTCGKDLPCVCEHKGAKE